MDEERGRPCIVKSNQNKVEIRHTRPLTEYEPCSQNFDQTSQELQQARQSEILSLSAKETIRNIHIAVTTKAPRIGHH